MNKPAKLAPNLSLKRARQARGWSQEDLAEKIGTDAFTIGRWERGVTRPSPHFRQKLAALFGLSPLELGLVMLEEASLSGQASVTAQQDAPLLFSAQVPFFDPALPSPPAGIHSLVGRDDLLRQVKERLLSGSPGATFALYGLPGVGKTALATALAHDSDVQTQFPDGVLWAGLGYQPDVLSLLTRWGTALGAGAPDLAQRSRPDAWASSIRAAIGQRRLLLIIDDAWEIAHALAFQVGGPHCAHLVTTRFPMLARRFAVEGALGVQELNETDGRLMLMRLAPEVVQTESEEAQALVAAVGGLPLALTLLGHFLRALAHSGQPRRMRAALEQLRRVSGRLQLQEPQTLVGGHPSLGAGTPLSLQAVIGISDQQLSENARACLYVLAVFPPKPNSFSEAAALAVCAQGIESLDELTDAGLVESSGPERYHLHQTIVDYARARQTTPNAAERLATYFIAFTEAHAEDYPALERETNNILAALEAAFEQSMRLALVRGVHALAPFLMTRGLFPLAERHLQRSLEAAQAEEDRQGQTTAWLHLGRIAEHRGDYGQAQTCWQQALVLARADGDLRGEALALRELGGLAWEQSLLPQAEHILAEAVGLLQQLGEQQEIASALMTLGNVAADQGAPTQARDRYAEALAIFRQLGDQRGTARALHNLGILAREQGQPEQAQMLYTEALAIFRQLGDQRSLSAALSNLGNLTRQQHQFAQAQQHLDEALTIQRHLGWRRQIAYTLLNLGSLASDQRHFEQAQQHLKEALVLFQELSARREIALTLQSLGIVARKEGHFEPARQHLQEALTIAEDLHDLRQQALTQRELGVLAREERQAEEARQHFERALALLHQLEDRLEAALTRLELGGLARQQGQGEEADALLAAALETLRQIPAPYAVAQVLQERGLLLQQQGQPEQAVSCLLGAGVGFAIVHAPDTSLTEELLRALHAQLSAAAWLSSVQSSARAAPESAYGLDQTAWAQAVSHFASQVIGATRA